ncbi:hypothetical protein ILUMI_17412, partial [Ignelater luminosus]
RVPTALNISIFADPGFSWKKDDARKGLMELAHVAQLGRPWQIKSTKSVKKVKGDGKRYMISHAGNSNRFIPGTSLIFSLNTKNPDYHGEINEANFVNWLEEQLLKSLEEPSVITDGGGLAKAVAMWNETLEQMIFATSQNCISHKEKIIVEWWEREVCFDREDVMALMINLNDNCSSDDDDMQCDVSE